MIHPIRKHLYISGVAAVHQTAFVWDQGVRSVLRLDRLRGLQWSNDFEVLHLPVGMRTGELSPAQFSEGAGFIAHMLAENPAVMVQCVDGVDRSVAFVLAYLIEYQHMSLPEAFVWLTMRYYQTNPHPALMFMLVEHYDLPYRMQEIFAGDFFDRLVVQAQRRIDRVQEGLFISGVTALQRTADVRAAGVESVLRLDRQNRHAGQWDDDFELLDLPFSDGASIPPGYLAQGTAFIHQQREAGKSVLVHCQMGISRASTLMMAYLIRYENLSLAEAYARVVAKRPFIYPNRRLMASLVAEYDLPYTHKEINSPAFWDQLLEEL